MRRVCDVIFNLITIHNVNSIFFFGPKSHRECQIATQRKNIRNPFIINVVINLLPTLRSYHPPKKRKERKKNANPPPSIPTTHNLTPPKYIVRCPASQSPTQKNPPTSRIIHHQRQPPIRNNPAPKPTQPTSQPKKPSQSRKKKINKPTSYSCAPDE